ncbi:unnamed protein product [Kuraishia capsulata CBS 1993]|uniref:Uncharacterized protein n=1 Tax=Kuraishia capsulata CBS 1993 TaxID=1382522 RepID=W6MIJ5_9ASCO|nr:uncharacterized protein KUCA_T00001703001 [Kuraishia capsulata CBS 1993]CDK25733.1 unnamed protein product [Kuraishia capsulata CBS 1993]
MRITVRIQIRQFASCARSLQQQASQPLTKPPKPISPHVCYSHSLSSGLITNIILSGCHIQRIWNSLDKSGWYCICVILRFNLPLAVPGKLGTTGRKSSGRIRDETEVNSC